LQDSGITPSFLPAANKITVLPDECPEAEFILSKTNPLPSFVPNRACPTAFPRNPVQRTSCAKMEVAKLLLKVSDIYRKITS